MVATAHLVLSWIHLGQPAICRYNCQEVVTHMHCHVMHIIGVGAHGPGACTLPRVPKRKMAIFVSADNGMCIQKAHALDTLGMGIGVSCQGGGSRGVKGEDGTVL